MGVRELDLRPRHVMLGEAASSRIQVNTLELRESVVVDHEAEEFNACRSGLRNETAAVH